MNTLRTILPPGKRAYRLGAVAYVLWGVMHVGAGAAVLLKVLSGGGVAALAVIGSAVPPGELPASMTGVEQGIIAQHAWDLIVAGVFATVIGATMNWRNLRVGYWLNLGVVSGFDLGFIFAILLPGYIKVSEGIGGPVLWLAGAVLTTIGLRGRPEESR